MRYNFCTLFDSNYLTRGLALHQSLLRHAGDFKLWILCMDEEVYDILSELKLERVSLIALKELEDNELLKIKSGRTAVEYCWTLTPSLPLYVLKQHPELKDIAYLDADTFFYSSPQPIYDEFVDHDALIVKHNYSPQFAHKEKESGTYNVELLIFRNNVNGTKILQWWRDRCIEWCFFRYEDGKLGDQLYLNDWTDRFEGVRVLKHQGGGVAPWNVDKFKLNKKSGIPHVDEKPVIFYHYHAFRWYTEQQWTMQPYEAAENYWFPHSIHRYFYKPYHRALGTALQKVRSIRNGFAKGFHPKPERTGTQKIEYALKWIAANQLPFYVIGATIFFFILNQLIWPTSDEYFYASLAHSFSAAQHGLLAWSDINTEHVALLSFLAYLWNAIIHPTSLLQTRIVMLPFLLATLLLIYGTAKESNIDRKYWPWFLWLLLLIPGFWLFSVRLMLDFTALFDITLIIYLLVKKAPAWQIAVGVIALLLLKEYYLYIIAPVILVINFADNIFLRVRNAVWKRLLWALSHIAIIWLPALLVTLLLLDFNLLPYPRLLENSLVFILGDVFTAINKTFLLIVSNVLSFTNSDVITPDVITPDVITPDVITPDVITPDVITNLNTVKVFSAAKELHYTGSVGEGITQSTANYPAQTFFTRLWWIYTYNFAESHISAFFLALFGIGLVERSIKIWRGITQGYKTHRTELIMFLVVLMFMYFNYHEADNQHGFRITMPVVIALVYFSFYGARAILESSSKRMTFGFLAITTAFVTMYYISTLDIEYGSVLANDSALSFLFAYKDYVFISGYVLVALFFVVFSRVTFSLKYWLLACAALSFFVVKHIPYYLDARLANTTYSYDYSIPEAQIYLQKIGEQDNNIYSNAHPYKVRYYARDPFQANVGINPAVREFKKIYNERYFRFSLDNTFMDSVRANKISYVFIVNDEFSGESLRQFEEIRNKKPKRFTLIDDYYHNDRLQWALYKVNIKQLN